MEMVRQPEVAIQRNDGRCEASREGLYSLETSRVLHFIKEMKGGRAMIKKGKEGAAERVIGTVLIVMSVVLLMVYASASQGQNTQGNTKEYTNSTPAFTISYPADWVEQPAIDPFQVLRVGTSGPMPYPNLAVSILPPGLPLEQSAKDFASNALGRFDKDVKILYERPSQLNSGAPAYEAELEWVRDGKKLNTLMVATKKDGQTVMVYLNSPNGRIGEDLKKIVYSLDVK